MKLLLSIIAISMFLQVGCKTTQNLSGLRTDPNGRKHGACDMTAEEAAKDPRVKALVEKLGIKGLYDFAPGLCLRILASQGMLADDIVKALGGEVEATRILTSVEEVKLIAENFPNTMRAALEAAGPEAQELAKTTALDLGKDVSLILSHLVGEMTTAPQDVKNVFEGLARTMDILEQANPSIRGDGDVVMFKGVLSAGIALTATGNVVDAHAISAALKTFNDTSVKLAQARSENPQSAQETKANLAISAAMFQAALDVVEKSQDVKLTQGLRPVVANISRGTGMTSDQINAAATLFAANRSKTSAPENVNAALANVAADRVNSVAGLQEGAEQMRGVASNYDALKNQTAGMYARIIGAHQQRSGAGDVLARNAQHLKGAEAAKPQ